MVVLHVNPARADEAAAQEKAAAAAPQGYAYEALRQAAHLARAVWDDPGYAARLEDAARQLRQRFLADFRLPEENFPALALDGEGNAADALASDAGHLLWTGLLDQERGEAVGRRLAREGVLGRFALDFLAVRQGDTWAVHAIELNLRKGGTTHPYLTLQFLTDGRYDGGSGRFLTAAGHEKHLVATDHLEDPALRTLSLPDLFDVLARNGLHFDHGTQTGVVFHMISSITECGRVGMTAIGDTPDSAQDVFDRAESALLAEARASLVPLAVPKPGRLDGGPG